MYLSVRSVGNVFREKEAGTQRSGQSTADSRQPESALDGGHRQFDTAARFFFQRILFKRICSCPLAEGDWPSLSARRGSGEGEADELAIGIVETRV